MKYLKLLIRTACVALTLFWFGGCDRVDEHEHDYDNVVYIQQATTRQLDAITITDNDKGLSRSLQASLAQPEAAEVRVGFAAEPSLLASFNEANGKQSVLLGAEHYSFSENSVSILPGNVRSANVELRFKGLEQLDKSTVYLLPVRMNRLAGGVKPLGGSSVMYYTIEKGALINTVPYLGENGLDIPGFSTSAHTQGLTTVTIETVIRQNAGKFISTILGIEGYFLIRIGDLDFPDNQIQLATNGGNVYGPALTLKRWHHFALTFDVETKQVEMYLDGKHVCTRTSGFKGAALDLADNPENEYDFHIGYAYEQARYLDGYMAETRIWNVIRTEEQIRENRYGIDPSTPGLVAYWKMNEGNGSSVKDHTGHGLDAVARKAPLKWIKVELPEE